MESDAQSVSRDERLRCESCGEFHKNARLMDFKGEKIGMHTQRWGYICMAKTMLKMPLSQRRAILENILEKRGESECQTVKKYLLEVHGHQSKK